jgi:hypothetical protein
VHRSQDRGEEDEAEALTGFLKRLRDVGRGFFSEGAAAFIAFVTGIVALLFTLFPGLKPFTATELRVAVRIAAVDRQVTLDQWRWRVALGDAKEHARLVSEDPVAREFGDDCGRGTELGFVLFVNTDARGFKRRELTVRAALYNAVTRVRVKDTSQLAVLARVPIDAPTAESVQQVWVWEPSQGPRLYARVEVYDPENHLLAFDDTKPFKAHSYEEKERTPGVCLGRPQ